MKTIPIGTPGWTELSIRFHGLDAAKDEAMSFARKILRDNQFKEDEIAVMYKPGKDQWCVARTKDSINKVNRVRDSVRNANGYRAKNFGFNPSAV